MLTMAPRECQGEDFSRSTVIKSVLVDVAMRPPNDYAFRRARSRYVGFLVGSYRLSEFGIYRKNLI